MYASLVNFLVRTDFYMLWAFIKTKIHMFNGQCILFGYKYFKDTPVSWFIWFTCCTWCIPSYFLNIGNVNMYIIHYHTFM